MAAAAVTPVGTGGGAGTSRFAAACGALSQYVKQAAEAERMHMHARPAAAVPVRPLQLMPGADVSEACRPDDSLDHLAQAAPAPAQMMTIVYGGRVLLVLDDVPADNAAGMLRLAAGAAAAAQGGAGTKATTGAKRGGQGQVSVCAATADLLPVARKASLQRFMEKRKVRVAARTEPYRRPDVCPNHLKLAL